MSDLVGNPEDRFSHEAHIRTYHEFEEWMDKSVPQVTVLRSKETCHRDFRPGVTQIGLSTLMQSLKIIGKKCQR